MVFVPGGARVFDAHRNHGKRCHGRTVAVSDAIARRGKPRITTGIGGRRPLQGSNPRRGIELRQPVKGLIRETIGGPVLTHASKIMVEAAVFLGHENDVIDALQVVRGVACHQTPAAAEDNHQTRERQYREYGESRLLITHLVSLRSEIAGADEMSYRTPALAKAHALPISLLRFSLIDLRRRLY